MNGSPTDQGCALPDGHFGGHFSHGGIITGLKEISFMPHYCARADGRNWERGKERRRMCRTQLKGWGPKRESPTFLLETVGRELNLDS